MKKVKNIPLYQLSISNIIYYYIIREIDIKNLKYILENYTYIRIKHFFKIQIISFILFKIYKPFVLIFKNNVKINLNKTITHWNRKGLHNENGYAITGCYNEYYINGVNLNGGNLIQYKRDKKIKELGI